jgi:D-apionolactonase
MSTPARNFAVGALAFRFDADTGMVRRIRFHGHEILRGIYAAVRDEQWATLSPNVATPVIERTDNAIRITFSTRIAAGAAELAAQTEIEAQADGRLRYSWRANVLRDLVTNRTGVCVLHPADAAGQPCVVEHADGRAEASWFPRDISPHQPFRDVRAITHVFATGAEVRVRMEGEIFETEDQRNWTDASFKTYCRPLDRPRPYRLSAGSTIEHVISVAVHGAPRPAVSSSEGAPPIRISEISAAGTLSPRSAEAAAGVPRIGFTLPGPLPAALRERVRALRPAHLRVETTAAALDATLGWARRVADFVGCELELAVRGATTAAPERTRFPARCTVGLFDDDGNTASADVLAAWRRAGFDSLATGTVRYFTELNRQRPPVDGAHHLVAFGLNAQVHAFDDASMLETLSQHAVVARHAHAIGAGRRVSVGPILLGPKSDSADARLHSPFGACWMLGSLRRLAGAGCVERVTFFHTHGPGGFLREDFATPIESVLLELARSTAAEPVALAGEARVNVDTLLLHSAGHRCLLVAHDDDRPLDVDVPYSGFIGTRADAPAPFPGGRALLPPGAIWQLTIPA